MADFSSPAKQGDSLLSVLSETEARALVRVTLHNGDFAEDDFTDSINLAHDVIYRLAAAMQDKGVEGFTETTAAALNIRRARGDL